MFVLIDKEFKERLIRSVKKEVRFRMMIGSFRSRELFT